MMKNISRIKVSGALLIGCCLGALPVTAKRSVMVRENPDLTVNALVASGHASNVLGSTGAWGWIYCGGAYSSEGVTQILVTQVDPDTPASGVLENGDVILGATPGSTVAPFLKNARHEMGFALLQAESSKNGGKLTLKVWRKGKVLDVALTIPVIDGVYRKDAPLTCERTQAVIGKLAATIAKRGLKGWLGTFDGLGLLATGDKTHYPMLAEFAQSLAPKGPLDINAQGKQAWTWGYTNLFLCEYYGATGDTSVLPSIKEYATKIAMGQSAFGTWAHRMAIPNDPANNGKLNGRLGVYGAINQPSLSCVISLVLAQKCGVDNKHISAAIKRSANHFRYFVDKGSVPYGVNNPWMRHDSNGKNGSAAVFFDLIGDAEAAGYYARMVTASYQTREDGHTGHFFSQVWGAPGVARIGVEALNAYTNKLQWYYQLERRVNGQCFIQLRMNGNSGSYKTYSVNGVRLIHYCTPRNNLYITGKGGRSAAKLTGKDLAETIAAGDEETLFKGRDTKALLGLLGNWSPIIREKAAQQLGMLDEDVVADLIAMLDSPNRHARYGACAGLRYAGRGSTRAVDSMIEKGLRSKDLTMRYHTVRAFAHPRRWINKSWKTMPNGLGKASLRAVPALLQMATVGEQPGDPLGKLQASIAEVLFYYGRARDYAGVLARKEDLATVDRKLLLPAIVGCLKSQNGETRSLAMTDDLLRSLKSDEKKSLLDDVAVACAEGSMTNIGPGFSSRFKGLSLLAESRYPKGPEAGIKMLREYGRGSFPSKIFDPLMKFDRSALKPHLSVLKEWHAKKTVVFSKAKRRTMARNKNKIDDRTRAKWATQKKQMEQVAMLIAEIEESPAQ